MNNQEFDLRSIFAENMDVQIPDWLERSARPKRFYAIMKHWENLTSKIKDLAAPQNLKALFPLLKQQTPHFPEILGFCEVRPEMLKMIKTALYGVTFGCLEENQDDRNVFRYHYALNTAFDLMVIPQSYKCRRPEFMTEDGQVEKALASTIQNIFKIILDKMRSDEQDDHIDYMVYACAHFASPESRYSRASRKAISNAFKDYYCQLPPEERAMITQSIFYKKNEGTRELIDDLISDARSQIAQASSQVCRLNKDRKLV